MASWQGLEPQLVTKPSLTTALSIAPSKPNPVGLPTINLAIIKLQNLQLPGGYSPKKLGRGVRAASQNPYPIYDQNLRFSLPYS